MHLNEEDSCAVSVHKVYFTVILFKHIGQVNPFLYNIKDENPT